MPLRRDATMAVTGVGEDMVMTSVGFFTGNAYRCEMGANYQNVLRR